MAVSSALPRLTRPADSSWLGPHFYYDLIRLARKGWPTLARVAYLVVLLVSLTIMYRTQGDAVLLSRISEYARRAHDYAQTVILAQYLLVLVLLPVYVASSIVQERENQTLEALTLTHLTDRELVLGKFGARIMHLGAVVLSGFPLLAFMHLWGNVDIVMLAYHEACTLLLLVGAGSICILASAHSESTFQAISRSYAWLALVGVFALAATFGLPVVTRGLLGTETAIKSMLGYLGALLLLSLVYFPIIRACLVESIRRMEYLRRQERRQPRKTTGALALTDDRPKPKRAGKRGQVQSHIHPWAWPIGEAALFWKECIKDGTRFSLSGRWLLIGLAVVGGGTAFFWLADSIIILVSTTLEELQHNRKVLRGQLGVFVATDYVIALAAYALVVFFQMTMSVAGEREQDTLVFLLLTPAERSGILFTKWLGPFWRNWPVLALVNLGVLLGLACGLYGPLTALYLVLLPWPVLLMVGTLGLFLSVICRRVLLANIALVGFLGLILLAHIIAREQTVLILSFHADVISEGSLWEVTQDLDWDEAMLFALGELAVFLLTAACFGVLAFRLFERRDYASG
jgi:ABC-type transport system involved in multi-copper enzyme maturation permease subunit